MKTTIQNIFRYLHPSISSAEDRRTTALGGIRFNGEVVTHMDREVDLKDGDTFQRGKHKRVRNGSSWDYVEQIEPYTQYRMTLTDDYDLKQNKTLELRARPSGHDNMLLIGAKGYGEMTAMDGGGYPILVEFNQGEFKVMIWADINQEEPTHIISLEGAREDARESDEF